MPYSYIQSYTAHRIATITLNRPEKKNALNDQFVAELTKAFTLAESDSHAKVILLCAQGDVFSAGADLAYLQKLQQFSFEENLADSNSLKELFLKISGNKKPVIAQVEGHAIAGGCGLATICDFCFAVPEAKFGYTEVKIGFIPALVSVFLQKKITDTHLRELLLTGKLITATEAKNMGLVNAVIEKEQIAASVKSFADKICNGCSSQSLEATKSLLNKIPGLSLDEALSLAARMNADARGSDDCKKGIASFLEKKDIVW